MKYSTDFEYNFSKCFGNTLIKNYETILKNYCLTVLKPECLLTGKATQALKIYAEYGYHPIYIKIKILSQEQIFSLWKYGWSQTTILRVLMNCITMGWNNCAIVVLKSKNNGNDACEFLNSKKGTSMINQNNSDTIRSKLNSLNIFLNYVHISDDTDDFIREIPILLDYNEIIELMSVIKSEKLLSKEEVNNILQPHIKNYVIESPTKLFRAYIDALPNRISVSEELKNELECAYRNKKISYELFIKLFNLNAIELNWTNIIIFSQFVDY